MRSVVVVWVGWVLDRLVDNDDGACICWLSGLLVRLVVGWSTRRMSKSC